MKKLIRSILTLAKVIFSDEKEKNSQGISTTGFFSREFRIKKEDLSLRIIFDWSGRSFDDDRDLYRYKLIVSPEDWDSNKCIRLWYDIENDLFFCQRVYLNSGKVHIYNDEDMLKHIHDILKCISEERGI